MDTSSRRLTAAVLSQPGASQTETPGGVHSLGVAAIAFDVGLDDEGRYVDPATGHSLAEVVAAFSRMKYGDLDAITFFAGHVAATALRNTPFMAFCRRAEEAGRFTYVISTAMFNVPSASNLLARATADRLNVGLARQGLSPVINAGQTRLSESPLGYARRTLTERANAAADESSGNITIVPEMFRGQSVVFLDDLFNSGYSAQRTLARLQKIGVAETFCLFAARVDPQTVAATDGTLEYALNNAVIDGSLASILPMMQQGNFAVVQKLMKITMDPVIIEELPRFLRAIPTASIMKLYFAAANNDYRRRYHGEFAPAVGILEAALQERGELDANGLPVLATIVRPSPPS